MVRFANYNASYKVEITIAAVMNKRDEKENDEVITEQIIEYARGYHASDFPNPNRKACPPEDVLIQTIESGNLPDENLRLHLLNCSPCFQDFRAIRSEKSAYLSAPTKTRLDKEKRAWTNVFRQPLIAFTALVLLAVSLASALFFALRGQPQSEYTARTPARSDTQPNIESKNQSENKAVETLDEFNRSFQLPETKTKSEKFTKQKSEINKAKTSPKTNPSREYLAKNFVNLDLTKAAVTRSSGKQEIIFPLKADSVNLNVKLPVNSPAGVYKISLLDEFGKPVIESQIKQANGKNLQVKFDLRNKSGRARLCIAPKGEVPDCLAVKIGNAP